jgi:hypothetical protein
MLDKKFSAEAFAAAGFGTKEARALAKEMQHEIVEELDNQLEQALALIIQKLNALGHDLQPYGQQLPGEKHYRETYGGSPERYKFLVAVDTVVTVGYPHTTDSL